MKTQERILKSYDFPDNSYYFANETSQDKIELMREMCEQLESHMNALKLGGLRFNCWLDDWGRFDNFQFAMTYKGEISGNLPKGIAQKAKSFARKFLKDKGVSRIETTASPQAIYSYCFGQSYLEGYRDKTWVFDVDF